MAYNVPSINKIFDDLDSFREFCAYAYLQGHSGYVFDEKNLYNEASWIWRAYLNRHKGPPPRRNKNFRNKPNGNGNNNYRAKHFN